MSLEQRISKLEAVRAASPSPQSVQERIDAGTASWEDYAAIYSDDSAELQDEFLAQAPFKVAISNSQFRHRLTPDFAVAYPPDRSLPPETQTHFDELVESLEFDVEEGLSLGYQRKKTTEEYRSLCARLRYEAAVMLLCYGGFDGLSLRRRIWVVEDDHWVLIPEIWAAATTSRSTVNLSDSFREVTGLYSAWRDGQIGDPNDQWGHISYADVAHFIGMPTLPVIDHTAVKSGQNRSPTPPRPWPSSLPELEISTSIAGLPRRIAPGQTP